MKDKDNKANVFPENYHEVWGTGLASNAITPQNKSPEVDGNIHKKHQRNKINCR